jgi:hypothetical protein
MKTPDVEEPITLQTERLQINRYQVIVRREPGQDTESHLRFRFTLVLPNGVRLFGSSINLIGLRRADTDGTTRIYTRDAAVLYAFRYLTRPLEELHEDVRNSLSREEEAWFTSPARQDLRDAIDHMLRQLNDARDEMHLVTLH